jgi:hypothetical protein
MSALEVVFELVKILPFVLSAIWKWPVFRGQRRCAESRSLLNGLGEAIETQFSRWNFTEAERRGGSAAAEGAERQGDRGRARHQRAGYSRPGSSLYSKAGLMGRAALSAFLLEDLLAPIEKG